MAGFGSMDSMNKSMKNNRALLKKNSVWEKMKNYASPGKRSQNPSKDKKATSEQLEEIRKRSIAENNRQIIRITIKMIIVGIVIAIIWWMLTENTVTNHKF